MPRDATLLSVEINPHFHALMSRIEDDRLIAHLGSAGELREIVTRYGLDAPDATIPGIPFSTMSHSERAQILEAVAPLLAPNGRFVAR